MLARLFQLISNCPPLNQTERENPYRYLTRYTKTMNNRILNFNKTDHFLYRQWDRGIPDEVLSEILRLCPKNKSNIMVIVPRKALRRLGLKKKKELFIKLDKNILITCFYCALQNYFSHYKRDQDYHLLSSTCDNRKNPTNNAF